MLWAFAINNNMLFWIHREGTATCVRKLHTTVREINLKNCHILYTNIAPSMLLSSPSLRKITSQPPLASKMCCLVKFELWNVRCLCFHIYLCFGLEHTSTINYYFLIKFFICQLMYLLINMCMLISLSICERLYSLIDEYYLFFIWKYLSY